MPSAATRWRRPVTIHSHAQIHMDRLGRSRVTAGMARRSIRHFKGLPCPVIASQFANWRGKPSLEPRKTDSRVASLLGMTQEWMVAIPHDLPFRQHFSDSVLPSIDLAFRGCGNVERKVSVPLVEGAAFVYKKPAERPKPPCGGLSCGQGATHHRTTKRERNHLFR